MSSKTRIQKMEGPSVHRFTIASIGWNKTVNDVITGILLIVGLVQITGFNVFGAVITF